MDINVKVAPHQMPLGLFDSGVGGLSIWREIVHQLPHESTVYVADSANCPYGSRSAAELQLISASIVEFLLAQNCKLIVVACNTASAAALHWLRRGFVVPFVGLEPAIKPAIERTRTGHVGVLATAGTLQGELFQNTRQRYAHGVQVHVRVGEGLVELIEAGHLDTPDMERLLRSHLETLLAYQIDQLVLGCTHYPLLLPLIRQLVGPQVTVIDPAMAVARQVKRVLAMADLTRKNDEARSTHHTFYTTGQPTTLQTLVANLMGQPQPVNQLQLLTPSTPYRLSV